MEVRLELALRVRAIARVVCGSMLALGAALSPALAGAATGDEVVEHGRFKSLHLLKPAGPAMSTVLLFSGSAGWNAEAAAYAETLRRKQTLVAGIDTPSLLAELAKDGGDCEFLDGDLDNLGRFVQAYTHQDDYRPPLLFGIGDGAAIVFGVLAQSPAKSFAGGVGVGFCPRTRLHPPLCKGTALEQRNDASGSTYSARSRLRNPFIGVVTPDSSACGGAEFLRRIPGAETRWPMRRQSGLPSAEAAAIVAYGTLAADVAPAQRRPEALPDLPLVEVPYTQPDTAHRDVFAILISGDGGWAGLDEGVADVLAQKGIPVVGVDSLRYFWTARTPETVAADLDRLIAHYTTAWKRPRVMLLGYSQGADILPFAMNRLSPASRAHIVLNGAVALSSHAAFEFHVGAWAGQAGGMETQPELVHLTHRQSDFVIVCGADDEDAICPKLNVRDFRTVVLPGSHHFDGEYEKLGQTLVDALPAPAAP